MDKFNYDRLLRQVGGTDPRKAARAEQAERLKAIKDRATVLTQVAKRAPAASPATPRLADPKPPTAPSPWESGAGTGVISSRATGDGPAIKASMAVSNAQSGPWANRARERQAPEPAQAASAARTAQRRPKRRQIGSLNRVVFWLIIAFVLWQLGGLRTLATLF